MLKTIRSAAIIGLGVAALTGCVSVYRMDVQQGNVLPPDRLEQLKTGMSRSQVRFVLGTPLVTDPFHPDRWDYVYYFRPGSTGQAETRHVSLFFRNDALQRIVDSAGGITPPAGNPAPPETPAP